MSAGFEVKSDELRSKEAHQKVKSSMSGIETVTKYKKRFETLKSLRTPIETKWKQVRDLLDPAATKYLGTDSDDSAGVNIDDSQILDTTPRKMMQTAADGLHGGLSSPSQQWFSFYAGNYQEFEASASHEAKVWLNRAEECVRDVLANSNYYQSLHSLYKEMLEFGISLMIVYSDPQTIVRFYPYTVGSFWCAQNNRRFIDTVFTKVMMSAIDIADFYGYENLPAIVKEAIDNGRTDDTFTVVQCIQPYNFFGDYPESSEFQYEDVRFVDEANDEDPVIYRSGFRTKPFIVARWAEPWDYVYPRSCPGIDALPDLRQLYEATRDFNMAVAWTSRPAWLVDASLGHDIKELAPGQIIEVSGSGAKNPIAPAIPPAFNFEANITLRQNLIEKISGIFYNREIMMVTSRALQNHVMTATEVDQLRQEKNAVMGPITVRASADIHIPSLDRTYEIITLEWMILDEPPSELVGEQLKPYFTSDLAITQRQAWAQRANEVLMWLQGVVQIAGPSILNSVDFDRWLREFERTDTIPAVVLRDPDEVEAINQQQAQQMAQQEELAKMQALAKTGRDAGATPTEGKNLAARMLGGENAQGGAGEGVL